MLTENDVVAAVSAHLRANKYCVTQALNTGQQGIDIVAKKIGANKLHVEAKGETSSKAGSSRSGVVFTNNQKRSHVAAALLWAAKQYENCAAQAIDIALAFPSDKKHQCLIFDIKKALCVLGVKVFFVHEDWSTSPPHRVEVFDPCKDGARICVMETD